MRRTSPGGRPTWLNCTGGSRRNLNVLVCRSLADVTDLAYYVVFGPAETTLREMARVAGSR